MNLMELQSYQTAHSLQNQKLMASERDATEERHDSGSAHHKFTAGGQREQHVKRASMMPVCWETRKRAA